VKHVRIHHEGGQSGPRAAGAMADWRRALLDLERSRGRAGDDDLVTAFFQGMAHLALVRTLEGREN
jgi:hypothetical protein